MQQCVGEDTDRAAMAKAEATWLKMGCPKSEPQKLGAAYSYDSSCKLGASTMKTHSVLTYPSDASIHSVTTVDSGDGTAAVTNTSDARWLGPCKPGQKPGDHQVMNLDELTKPH
jgi:hypothetical protein